ncbi:MAG: peptidylprolyl isomerase [Bacteroidales bacterium]|jgi:peptidyl-prolyl cis-trans isomerase B (cyclophilin B)|nr:peptidylprolyl isomerase [Bacteroidales bacterium]
MKSLLFSLLLLISVPFAYGQDSTKVAKKKITPIPNAEYDYLVTINTGYGQMKLLLFDETPEHKRNFIRLAKLGVYNGTDFFRVIEKFMIQGGNPKFKKNPDPKDIERLKAGGMKPEIKPHIKHVYGSIASPSSKPGVKSNSAQFYIVENKNGAPHLDGKYTVFGRVVSGLETITKIARVKTNSKDRPLREVWMNMKIEKVKRSDIKKFYVIDFY